MILKSIYKVCCSRIFICGLLASIILFQVVTPILDLGHDLNYNIEWNDGSDSGEADKIDIGEKEIKKEFNQGFSILSKWSHFSPHLVMIYIEKHPSVDLDITLPPPECCFV